MHEINHYSIGIHYGQTGVLFQGKLAPLSKQGKKTRNSSTLKLTEAFTIILLES